MRADRYRHRDLSQGVVQLRAHLRLEEIGPSLLYLHFDDVHGTFACHDLVRGDLTALFHQDTDRRAAAAFLFFSCLLKASVEVGLSSVHAQVSRRVDEEAADVARRSLKFSPCDPSLSQSLSRIVAVRVLFRTEGNHIQVVLGPDHRGCLFNTLGSVLLASGCPPVSHDNAAEAELASQNCRQKIVLGRCPRTVYRTVSGHNGGRRAFPHRDLKPS